VTRFHQAWLRARQDAGFSAGGIQCGGERYQLMQLLGSGEISQVHVAQRIGPLPFLATIKLSSAPAAAARYAREAQVLRELQTLQSGGAGAYFSQRLPEVVAAGVVEGGDHTQQALVLRHPNGYWGSPGGAAGALWARPRSTPCGVDLAPDARGIEFHSRPGLGPWRCPARTALVHPQDHGVLLIGWTSAQKGANAKDRATDLLRSARVVLVLLNGASEASAIPSHVPAGLAQLLTRARSRRRVLPRARRGRPGRLVAGGGESCLRRALVRALAI